MSVFKKIKDVLFDIEDDEETDAFAVGMDSDALSGGGTTLCGGNDPVGHFVQAVGDL